MAGAYIEFPSILMLKESQNICVRDIIESYLDSESLNSGFTNDTSEVTTSKSQDIKQTSFIFEKGVKMSIL